MSDDRYPTFVPDGVGSYDDPARDVKLLWHNGIVDAVQDPLAETQWLMETDGSKDSNDRPTRYCPGMSLRDVAEAHRELRREQTDHGKWESYTDSLIRDE